MNKYHYESAEFAPSFNQVEKPDRNPGFKGRRPDKCVREERIEAAIWEDPRPRIIFSRYFKDSSGRWRRSCTFFKEDLENLAKLCRRVRSLYGI